CIVCKPPFCCVYKPVVIILLVLVFVWWRQRSKRRRHRPVGTILVDPEPARPTPGKAEGFDHQVTAFSPPGSGEKGAYQPVHAQYPVPYAEPPVAYAEPPVAYSQPLPNPYDQYHPR